MRDIHASLGVQASQLKNSIQNRERRRNAERSQRMFAAELEGTVDVYDVKQSSHHSGSGPSKATATLAAISAASARRATDVIRCDLCQVSFTTEPQYQQHVSGPVHRKAEEKQLAAQAKAAQRAMYSDVAAAAVAVGEWHRAQGQSRGETQQGHPTPSFVPPTHTTHGSRSGGNNSRQPSASQPPNSRSIPVQGAQPPLAVPPSYLSHQDILAAARTKEEVLSIDGWVPPSIGLESSHPSSSTAAPSTLPNNHASASLAASAQFPHPPTPASSPVAPHIERREHRSGDIIGMGAYSDGSEEEEEEAESSGGEDSSDDEGGTAYGEGKSFF